MLVTDIMARLRTDTTGFNSGMSSATKALSSFQSEATHSSNALASMMGVAKVAAGAATTAITAASTALVGLGVKGVQGTASMEQLKIAMVGIFEGAGKSAQDAYDYLDRLQKFAATTPFEFPELAETSKKLMAVGYDGDQVINMLTAMGNAAAAAGKSGDSVIRLANALQRVKGSGRLTGETIMMMSDAMPTFNARAAIASKLYGGDMTAAMKALESGTVDADAAIGALIDGMKELAGAEGAMDRQSKTLIGIMSTFKDEVNMAMVKGLEPALPALEDALVKLIEPISSFTKNFGAALGPALASLTNAAAPALIQLAEVLGPVLGQIVSALGPALQGLLPVVSSIVKLFGSFLSVVAKPLSVLFQYLSPQILALVDALGTQLLGAMNQLMPAMYPLTFALIDIFKANLPVIQSMLQLALAVTPLITILATFTANVVSLAQSAGILTPIIFALVGSLLAMKVVSAVSAGITMLSDALLGARLVWQALTLQVDAETVATTGNVIAMKAASIAALVQKGALIAASVAAGIMTAAQWALNVAMDANPIGLIILAIVALIAAFVLAYTKIDWFRNFIDGAFSFIFNAISTVFNWVKDNWQKIGVILLGPIAWAVAAIIANWDKITSFFTEFVPKMMEFGKNLIEGLVKGMAGLQSKVLDTVKDIVMGPVNKVKEWLGIASPSKKMKAIGVNFGEGFALGISSKIKASGEAAQSMGEHSAARLVEGIGDGVKQAVFRVGEHGGAMLRDILPKPDALVAGDYKGKTPDTKPKSGSGPAKRLADIYVFGKLMGKKYGSGFADGYKTIRSVVQDQVDAMHSAAQALVDAAKSVSENMKDFGKFSAATAPDNSMLTAEGFIQSMNERIGLISDFNKQLKQLSSLKLNKDVFAEIVNAGPMAGSRMAAALLAGGAEAISAINSSQKALEAASTATSDLFLQGTAGTTLAYQQAQAGMTVEFTKDSVQVNVGAGASAADAETIRKAVVSGIQQGLAAAKKAAAAG